MLRIAFSKFFIRKLVALKRADFPTIYLIRSLDVVSQVKHLLLGLLWGSFLGFGSSLLCWGLFSSGFLCGFGSFLGSLSFFGRLGSSLLWGSFLGLSGGLLLGRFGGFFCLGFLSLRLLDLGLLNLFFSGCFVGSFNLNQSLGFNSLFQCLADVRGDFDDVDLIVSSHVFLDGGKRRTFLVCQSLDGSFNHSRTWGMSGRLLGCSGLLRGLLGRSSGCGVRHLCDW